MKAIKLFLILWYFCLFCAYLDCAFGAGVTINGNGIWGAGNLGTLAYSNHSDYASFITNAASSATNGLSSSFLTSKLGFTPQTNGIVFSTNLLDQT